MRLREGIISIMFIFSALPSGVKVLIVMSMVVVLLVIIYSVFYHCCNKCKWREQKLG